MVLGGCHNKIPGSLSDESKTEVQKKRFFVNFQERVGNLSDRLAGLQDRHSIHHHLSQPLRGTRATTTLKNLFQLTCITCYLCKRYKRSWLKGFAKSLQIKNGFSKC